MPAAIVFATLALARTPYDLLNVHSASSPGVTRIDLWQIDLSHASEPLHALLSPAERLRGARFLYPQDRAHYLVAHATMRQILAAALNTRPDALTFAQGPQGKPYLTGYPLHFNLAHAGGQALLALSPTLELGVDLEPIRPLPDFLALAENFSPAERANLQALAGSPRLPQAFFECWTRKEAFVKALGTGLSHPLESFSVTFHPSAMVELSGTQTEGWQLADLPHIPGFAAALCHARTASAPTIHRHVWAP